MHFLKPTETAAYDKLEESKRFNEVYNSVMVLKKMKPIVTPTGTILASSDEGVV